MFSNDNPLMKTTPPSKTIHPSKFASVDSLLNEAFIGSPPSGEGLFSLATTYPKPFEQKVEFLKSLIFSDYMTMLVKFSNEYQIINSLFDKVREWLSDLSRTSFHLLSCLNAIQQLFNYSSLEVEYQQEFQHVYTQSGFSGYLFEHQLQDRDLVEMYFTLNEKASNSIQGHFSFIKSSNFLYIFHHKGVENMENDSCDKFEFVHELEFNSTHDICTLIIYMYDFIGRRNNHTDDYLLNLAKCVEVRPWNEFKFGEQVMEPVSTTFVPILPNSPRTPVKTRGIFKTHKMKSNHKSNKKVNFDNSQVFDTPQIERVLKDITNICL